MQRCGRTIFMKLVIYMHALNSFDDEADLIWPALEVGGGGGGLCLTLSDNKWHFYISR